MTWWKSQSLQVPGNTTTPNFMRRAVSSRGSNGRSSSYTRPFDGVVLEDGIHEQLPAHLVDAGADGLDRVTRDVELDHLPDAQAADVGEAEAAERALDGRALHVHDPRLEPDEDAHPHPF